MGKGSIANMSQKQKMNTKSSTEAELIAVDDMSGLIMWMKYFLREQGYDTNNVVHQDNQSTIKMIKNGKESSTKRTRHIEIRYFYITDKIQNGELRVKYCPTDDMIADFMSKPL